ncbi:MAG: FAD-dependent monooxygenase, partial [Verrucomicrobiota bacterium]
METTDVLVIGGGPAGAAAALTLAQAGRRCALLEGRPVPEWKIGETLAPESRQLMLALGVWESFLHDGHLSSPGLCSVWGDSKPAEKIFIFNPHGSAWQLDRAQFEVGLLAATESAGVRVWRDRTAQTIRRTAGTAGGRGWEVAAGGEIFRAGWLIDASGRGSVVARQFGVTRPAVDRLVAVYAVVAAPPGKDDDARTHLEACAGGWWYSSLMPGGRRIFSFQTDADLLPDEPPWREAAWFWAQVDQARFIRALLLSPDASHTVAPKLTSANSSRLATCHGDGWVAAGDAAQSFDPLSGEGLFHALFSGQRAAQGVLLNLADSTHGLAEYAALSEALWRRFLHQRQLFYASETRWRNEPFWQRRLAPVGTPSLA